MPTSTIAETTISALEHPISALDDQPALSAADLKAYFDADPQQLCDAHNDLVSALTAPGAAASIGFRQTSGISASTLQDAVVNVQSQLSSVVSGSVPDGSISLSKLDASIQNRLNVINALQVMVLDLQDAVETIRPSGAQYPLMILALSDGCPEGLTDEIATAALGGHSTEVYDLGAQLGWLCKYKRSVMPSQTFLLKQTFTDIIEDVNTLREIAGLTPVYQLIAMSSEMITDYLAALHGES